MVSSANWKFSRVLTPESSSNAMQCSGGKEEWEMLRNGVKGAGGGGGRGVVVAIERKYKGWKGVAG